MKSIGTHNIYLHNRSRGGRKNKQKTVTKQQTILLPYNNKSILLIEHSNPNILHSYQQKTKEVQRKGKEREIN